MREQSVQVWGALSGWPRTRCDVDAQLVACYGAWEEGRSHPFKMPPVPQAMAARVGKGMDIGEPNSRYETAAQVQLPERMCLRGPAAQDKPVRSARRHAS
jgi:hypothetical protein